MLIVIEGSDFAGKSSVADRVDLQLRARGIQVRRSRTSLVRGPFHACAWFVHLLPGYNEALKSLAFHGAYAADALFWRPPSDKVIIQESYALRVLARDIVGHRSYGLIFMRKVWNKLPRPDLTYFLDCSMEERHNRYLHGNKYNRRDNARFGADADNHKLCSDLLCDLAIKEGYHLLNTEQMAIEDTASAIVDDILCELSTGPRMNITWIEGTPPEDMPVRQVYGILFDRSGRIFVQNDQGRYNLPGGKPEGDETPVETLRRECLEESQITPEDIYYLGYCRVENNSHPRSPYAQLRYIARLRTCAENVADPSTQRMYGRELLPPEEAIRCLNWGHHGSLQIRAAVELARLRFCIEEFERIRVVIPDKGLSL